jgi:hypothetical protein
MTKYLAIASGAERPLTGDRRCPNSPWVWHLREQSCLLGSPVGLAK